MWIYESPIGMMMIYRNTQGRFSLRIADDIYGHYHSAVAAADDVYTFSTGCNEWDFLCGSINPPIDLSEWLYIRPRR